MGKVIQGLIFLVLIGGVIVGAKMFVLDPMQKDKFLQEKKKKITALLNAGEHQKALDVCDEVVKTYPKQKAPINKRRFAIGIDWAAKSHDAALEAERKASAAKRAGNKTKYNEHKEIKEAHARNVLKAVDIADKSGTIEKVHQQWRSIAYGHIGEKEKAREAMKRQGTME